MARKNSSPKPKPKYSGNHQKSWLWGNYAVTETLRARRWPVLELYVTAEVMEEYSLLLESAAARGISCRVESADRLEQLAQTSEHQGFLARMGRFPYGSIAELNDIVPTCTRTPLIVLCDRLQDAFNFGAILRCCDGVKATAVIIGERDQVGVTPHVARSSSGAVNHLPIIQTDNLVEAVKQLRSMRFRIVAASEKAETVYWRVDLSGPTVIIIGNEASGIASELLAKCDQTLRIPMDGSVSSLNAAVAAGIMLYEIRRQQE